MRDYDPTTGRYIQGDPLGLIDGPSVYGYALQNPGRYVDPRGEQAMSGALAVAATAVAADGPFPFGDVLGACVVGGTAAYCWLTGSCSLSFDYPTISEMASEGRKGGAATGARKNEHKKGKRKSTRQKHTKKGAGTKTKARGKGNFYQR